MFAMVLYRIVILLLYSFRHQLLLRIIILTHYRQCDVILTADLIEYNVRNHIIHYIICMYIVYNVILLLRRERTSRTFHYYHYYYYCCCCNYR